ncbi:unnamed protein product [Plasmodium vivax]|uniref:(malaria parasite P. vivax) hypothetical protein n=1 Tax=Plasmodium vivax TaxID=5855 RepID=A0A8S4HNQ3_PLAVI|nr:unnamed protein product [Plasmodium vivax]
MPEATFSDIYKFFEDIDPYILDIEKVRNDDRTIDTLPHCSSFIDKTNIDKIESYKSVCRKIQSYIKIICSSKSTSKYVTNLGKYEYDYLNYLLNVELRKQKINSTDSLQTFLKIMNNSKIECADYNKLKEYSLYFYDKPFRHMDMLNKLYKNYYELYNTANHVTTESTVSCKKYYDECYNTFELGVKECKVWNKTFKGALEKFKELYESLENSPVLKDMCNASDIKKLRPINVILGKSPNILDYGEDKKDISKTILMPTIGLSMSLLFLYKYTPFGNMLRSKIKGKKKGMNSLNEKSYLSLIDTPSSSINNNKEHSYNMSYQA